MYSDAVKVGRPTGMISATYPEIIVDGVQSDSLKSGKNTVSVSVTNKSEDDCTVFLAVALNEEVNGVTSTNGAKIVSKKISGGKTEDIAAELTISPDTAFTSGKVMVIAIDNLEPAVVSSSSIEVNYVGIDDGACVYEIKKSY